MDQSLRTLLRNKVSDTERSPLGGLKLMVTWSVSCKPSRRVREFLNLKEKLFGREYKERLAAIAPHTPRRKRKSPDMLMFSRELRRKLPERIVPAGKISYYPIRQRDAAKKKQMKEYADKRRNARESLIVVGDQVLLNQSKPDVLTPAFDPDPSQQ